MDIKIILEGNKVIGKSKLLTDSTIEGDHVDKVDVVVRNQEISAGATVYENVMIKEKQNSETSELDKGFTAKSIGKGIGSFVRDVAVNLASGVLEKN